MTALQKTVWGLAAIAVTFLLAIAANVLHAYRLNEVKTWTLHTHQVIEELKDSLIGLEEVETSSRGYVISGKPEYISTFKLGKEAVFQHLSQVAALVQDSPEQLVLVNQARHIAAQKIAYGEQVIETTTEQRPNPDKGKGKGRQIMTAFKVVINHLSSHEEQLLADRTTDLLNIQRLNWATTAVLAAFILSMLAWVYQVARQAILEEQARVADLTREIEERKKMEAELIITSNRLVSSNMDLQQFAYVASHDLQEPLRAVAGFLTLIVSKNKGKLDEETECWINHAVEGAQRMRTLINDLLSFARVESQGKPLVKTDCNAALQRAQKNLSVSLKESGAVIESDRLPVIKGDEGQLSQLFQNLLSNAVKFKSAAVPHVGIKVVERQKEWLFTVGDNGIGFDEEHAKRIFVIFQRLHGRDEYKGTGIGLALCKKIVERHGGRIWAQSQPGKGSTFSFTIPVELKPSAGETISGHSAQSPEKKSASENPPDRG
ncbi:MAG: CHASE3 domain-containing protein [Cyanobacteria bacterium REEB67]|nr:CHASE3 domain-containing protein [Cyanobacteria bacterium REEB67]